MNVKSTPLTVDNVEHVMFSLPVTVNAMFVDVDVADTEARVATGAVVSIVIESALEVDDTFPAPSAWDAEMLQMPFAKLPS